MGKAPIVVSAARTLSISPSPRGTIKLTCASFGRLKKRFSIGFNTIRTARINTIVKRQDPSDTMVTVRRPAARSCRSRSRPTTAPRISATSRRTMRSSVDTALWYMRETPQPQRSLSAAATSLRRKWLGGRKQPALEGLDLRLDGNRGPVALAEKRLFDREEGVHQLRDPDLDLD